MGQFADFSLCQLAEYHSDGQYSKQDVRTCALVCVRGEERACVCVCERERERERERESILYYTRIKI